MANFKEIVQEFFEPVTTLANKVASIDYQKLASDYWASCVEANQPSEPVHGPQMTQAEMEARCKATWTFLDYGTVKLFTALHIW